MKTLSIPLIVLLFICLCGVQSKAQNLKKNYQGGCYYDTSGVKHTGLIDFGAAFGGSLYNKLNFKTDDSASNQKIPIAAVKSVVFQSDPDTIRVFTEWDTVTYERTLYFGKLCTSTSNPRIYSRKQIKSTNNGTGWTAGTPGQTLGTPNGTIHISGTPTTMNGVVVNTLYTVTQYLYEIDGGLTLPIYRSNYKEVLSKAFADDPELVAKIKNKTLKFPDLKEIIEQYQSYKSQARSK